MRYQFIENLFNALEIDDLFSHILQFVLGQSARFGAVGAIIQPQQLGDFVKPESQTLRGFDIRSCPPHLLVVTA